MVRRSSKPTLRSWLALATLVLILDQITKAWVYARFKDGERVTVIPGFFDFTLVWNPGAAFSFLASADGWQRWFFIAIGIERPPTSRARRSTFERGMPFTHSIAM